MNKLENDDEDLQWIVLDVFGLEAQLNDIDWETFDSVLVDDGVFIVGAVASGSQSF